MPLLLVSCHGLICSCQEREREAGVGGWVGGREMQDGWVPSCKWMWQEEEKGSLFHFSIGARFYVCLNHFFFSLMARIMPEVCLDLYLLRGALICAAKFVRNNCWESLKARYASFSSDCSPFAFIFFSSWIEAWKFYGQSVIFAHRLFSPLSWACLKDEFSDIYWPKW